MSCARPAPCCPCPPRPLGSKRPKPQDTSRTETHDATPTRQVDLARDEVPAADSDQADNMGGCIERLLPSP